MPVLSDLLEQKPEECKSQTAGQLLVWVCDKLGATLNVRMDGLTIDSVRDRITSFYAEDHGQSESLYEILKEMNILDREALIYDNPHDPMARKLAGWWEEHRELDEDSRQERIASALKKLTDDEKAALGLND